MIKLNDILKEELVYDHWRLKTENPFFGKNFGIGLKFSDDRGTDYISVAEKGKRKVLLEIYSFKGVSWGAIHYYGKLRVWGLSMKILKSKDKNEIGKVVDSAGYIDKFKPEQMKDIKIEISRQITDKELQDKDRWLHYSKGDYVDAFESKSNLIGIGQEYFKKYFDPKYWELKIDDHTHD